MDFVSGNIFWILENGTNRMIVVSKIANISAGYRTVIDDAEINNSGRYSGILLFILVEGKKFPCLIPIQ